MWNDFIKNSVLKPGLERLGTVAAVWLLAGGDWMCTNWNACGLVTKDGAAMVITYVIAVALLAFDVTLIHLRRREEKGLD